MRFLFALLMLAMPAVALAQDVPAKPKLPPESGKAILAIDNGGHSSAVADFAFTPDGKRLASVDTDKTVQVWDTVTGERLKVFRLPRPANLGANISSVAMMPDNATLAIAGFEFLGTQKQEKVVSYAYLLHLETGKLLQLPGLKKDVRVKFLTISGDGDHLAVGLDESSVRAKAKNPPSVQVWSGLKNAWKTPLAAPKELAVPMDGFLLSTVFAPRGNQLGVVVANLLGNEGRIYRWDVAKPGKPEELKNVGVPQNLAISPDGSRLANVAQEVKKLEIRSAEGKLLKSIAVKDLPDTKATLLLNAAPVFRGNRELLFAARSGTLLKGFGLDLFRYDLDKDELKMVQRLNAVLSPGRFALSPEGKRVAMQGGPNVHEIAIVNLEEDAKPVQIGRDLTRPEFAMSKKGYQFAWTGSSRDKLVAAPDEKFIAALDLSSAALLPKIDRAAFTNHGPAVSPDGKYVYGQFQSETLHIGKGKDLVAIFLERKALLSLHVSGQDWVVWTAEGYYAASPGGEKLVGWHVNNGDDKLATFYPVERFRKQLYRPDVIKLVLEKGSVAEALKTADAALGKETRDVKIDDLLPPRAVLSVVKQDKAILTLKVRAEASVKEQPITSLRLMLDGRIVPGKETLVEFKDGKPNAEVEWTFELPEGEHQLAVLARCPDSSAVSPAIRVKHVDAAKLPTLHVLTIGINNYKDKTLDLKYAAPDAQALAAAFAKHCTGQPFRDVKTKTLLNENATAKNITDELIKLRKSDTVAQQDLVIVFFACHGVKHKKDYYLLTHEADTEKLAETCLSGDTLRKALAEYKCQVLLMMDSCYAGFFDQGAKLAKSGLAPATDDATRDLTDEGCGVAVLCAARDHEKAEGKDGHGLFTRAVLDALEKKPGVPYNRHNQRVYVNHLHTYVLDEVRALSDDRQHPSLNVPLSVEHFVVR
jgi:WD40 repeat protein